MTDHWPRWWRVWAWLHDQIIGDDPDLQYSLLDYEDGRK